MGCWRWSQDKSLTSESWIWLVFALLCLLVGAVRRPGLGFADLLVWRWWSGTFGPFRRLCSAKWAHNKWPWAHLYGIRAFFFLYIYILPWWRDAPWFPQLFSKFTAQPSVSVLISFAPVFVSPFFPLPVFRLWPLRLFFIFVKLLVAVVWVF